MTAEESVRAGRLDEALAELAGAGRKKPADPKLRVFCSSFWRSWGSGTGR